MIILFASLIILFSFFGGVKMDYEYLIFGSLEAFIPALVVYFVVVIILDYGRSMIFYND